MNAETATAFEEAALGNIPTATEKQEDAGSLADHAEAFGHETRRGRRGSTLPVAVTPIGEEDNPVGEGRERHRAKSQQGNAADVEAIAALTKRLRDAETEAGFTIERKDGESERVFNLRRKAETAEAIRDARKLATAKPAPVVAAPVVALSDFKDPEPTIEEFKDSPDPYSAWQRAIAAWDRKKERFDDQQTAAKGSDEQRKLAAVANRQAVYKTFGERVIAYQALNKDYEAVVKGADLPTPPLLETALVGDPDGPKFIHELAKNPRLFDEFFLLTDGKPITHETVATTQRLLKSRMPAAVTGSVATSVVVPAPRPPNPVRTGPMRTAEKVPDDDGSLADHARAFGSTSTRRRR